MIKIEMKRESEIIENLVSDIESWPGFCDLGVNKVLDRLKSAGIDGFNAYKIKGRADKPNLYVPHFQAGRALAEVHFVAVEGTGGITIDVFQPPNKRVFPTLGFYLVNSGIEYTNDAVID